MTQRLQRVTGGFKPVNWLGGRASRKEYWIFVGALLALSSALTMAGLASSTGWIGALNVIWIRRFHDLGRTGWWAPAILVAQLAASGAALLVNEDLGLAVGFVSTLVAIITMGVIRGQPGDNRFGPPPGRATVGETFT